MAVVPLLGQSRPELPPEKLDYAAAYMVLIDDEGNYKLELDINKPITVTRKPTQSEVKGSLSVVLSDMEAISAADVLIAKQMMMAMGAKYAQENQQLAGQLGLK